MDNDLTRDGGDADAKPRRGGPSTTARIAGPALFQRYKRCIVRIAVTDVSGDVHSGTGFHIGDGWLVTARHVVKGGTFEIVGGDRDITIGRVLEHRDDRVDLAVLETTFTLSHYMTRTHISALPDEERIDHIPIGGHLNDWIGDEFTLSDVIVFGYPPIPFSGGPELVTVRAHVTATVDKYTGPDAPSFIISSVPRGGFSGGPVISEYGFLLGVATESLYGHGMPPELGFTAVLSVEPLWDILCENRVFPGSNAPFVRYLLELDDRMSHRQEGEAGPSAGSSTPPF